MDAMISALYEGWPLWALIALIAGTLFSLSKGADILVDEAVTLSVRWGIPKVLIGATIVSLGTTLPEAAVSVFAAVQGNPDLALGNAVGSIICDTGLIIGIAALISPLALDKRVTNRQGWLQIAAALLLIGLAFLGTPFLAGQGAFPAPGRIPRWGGFLFLALLILYIVESVRWARRGTGTVPQEAQEAMDDSATGLIVVKLAAGIFLIIASSKLLIPAVEVTAVRIGIPQSIIAATLVAFGTSLPELVTAVTAARQGHGDLAIGNVIGADILNVLFVVGASAAATPGGLVVPPFFFVFQFPVMLGILLVFRTVTLAARKEVTRPAGAILLFLYIGYTVVSYNL